MLSQADTTTTVNSLLASIDVNIRDEIERLGKHPFILVRLQQSPPQFVVCKTQNNSAEFVDKLLRLPDLGKSTLLRGIERTLCLKMDEAADALFSWIQNPDSDFVERVYLGISRDLKCPAYYGYPVLELEAAARQGSAEERLQLLLHMFEAYERSDGNNAMRFALMESLALALSRKLDEQDRGVEARRIAERGLLHAPHSIHLYNAKFALDAKARGDAARSKAEIGPGEEEFSAFVLQHFNAAYYLQTYDDVVPSGLEPLEHWLNRGSSQGRQISKSVVLRFGKIAKRSSNRNWKQYHWRGQDIAARLVKPIPPDIMTQILNQASHDPAILAAVKNTIAQSGDREAHGHVDVVGLRRAVPHGSDLLMLVPNLSEDQTFATKLLFALNERGLQSIQTIVVDQESSEILGENAIPELYRATNVLFWQDYLLYSPSLLRLAQLIRILRPRVMIVANSRNAHEMVAQFGPALSKCTRIYCIYTDDTEGRELALRFPRLTLPFATALTDDSRLAAKLRDQYGDLLGHGVELLPRDTMATFVDNVAALFGRS